MEQQGVRRKPGVRAGGPAVMLGELERCPRCQRRYPGPLGHRCPQASFAEQQGQDFDREFRAWLETSAGRFAQYLAARPAPAR